MLSPNGDVGDGVPLEPGVMGASREQPISHLRHPGIVHPAETASTTRFARAGGDQPCQYKVQPARKPQVRPTPRVCRQLGSHCGGDCDVVQTVTRKIAIGSDGHGDGDGEQGPTPHQMVRHLMAVYQGCTPRIRHVRSPICAHRRPTCISISPLFGDMSPSQGRFTCDERGITEYGKTDANRSLRPFSGVYRRSHP